MIAALEAHKFTDPKRLFLQSFEVGNLKDILKPLLAKKGLTFPLVQLTGSPTGVPYDFQKAGRKETYGDMTSGPGLKSIVAQYAAGIGPWKGISDLQTIIKNAHAANLLVHPYTFRDEVQNLTKPFKSPDEEYRAFFQWGVDGVFSDFPDRAVRARHLFRY